MIVKNYSGAGAAKIELPFPDNDFRKSTVLVFERMRQGRIAVIIIKLKHDWAASDDSVAAVVVTSRNLFSPSGNPLGVGHVGHGTANE